MFIILFTLYIVIFVEFFLAADSIEDVLVSHANGKHSMGIKNSGFA